MRLQTRSYGIPPRRLGEALEKHAPGLREKTSVYIYIYIYVCIYIYIYETHMAHILHLFLIGIRCAFGNRCAHPYAYENMGDASNKEM